MQQRRGKYRASSFTRCSTTRIVIWSSRFRETRSSKKSLTPFGFIWLTGSSKIRSFGCVTRIEASARRCLCPPDSAWILRDSIPESPVFASARRTSFSMTDGSSPRFSRANPTSSATVIAKSWSSGVWYTVPARSPMSSALISLTSRPSREIVPVSRASPGSKSPVMLLMSVDFPQPERPAMRTISPSASDRSTCESVSFLRDT